MPIDQFTKEQFEAALPLDSKTGVPLWQAAGLQKGEYVYTIAVKGTNKRIVVRSSVGANGVAADVGEDSIRHWVEYEYKGNWYPLSKDTKTYTTRVPGWAARLTESLRRLWAIATADSKRGKARSSAEVAPASKSIVEVKRAKAATVADPVKLLWPDKPVEQPKTRAASTFAFLDDQGGVVDIPIDEAPTGTIYVPDTDAVANYVGSLPLNQYQKDVVLALAQGPQVVEACPGSGKTRTLESLVAALILSGVHPSKIGVFTFSNAAASDARRRIAKTLWPEISDGEVDYLIDPFKNKTNVAEGWADADPARRMLRDWTCTIHALSYRLLRETGLKLRVLSGHDEYEAVNMIKDSLDEFDWDESHRSVRAYIGLAIRQLAQPGAAHDFYARVLAGTTVEWRSGQLAAIYRRYLGFCNSRNLIDFDMMQAMVIRKLREDPTFKASVQQKFDYVLVDEAQDTSPEQTEILWTLAERTGNVVFVGDVDQCLVSGTLVGGRPIETVEPGDLVPCGLGSEQVYRKVLRTYSHLHVGPIVTIRTKGGRELSSTPEHRHFAGYDKADSQKRYFTYLMHREDLGFRVGTTAYHRKDGEKISLGFEHRLRQERADRIWVLRACDTPGEASYWEQYFSVSYGIPTWIFYADGRSVTFDNDRISKLYGVIDSEVGATRLLKDEHMFWNYPHHTPRSTSKDRRRTFTVTMMGDSRSGSHRYAVSGSDKADGALLTAAGFFVRSAKAGRGWRIEGQSKDLEAVYQLHDDIIQHLPLNFKEQAKFSCGRLPVTPASHVLPGMKLFVLQSGKVTLDEVISVDIEDQIVKVYDLEVEDLHHFAANGILTHNSMYAFRGAEPAVLRERFAAHWPTVRRFNLPVNYRSTQAIVKAAADLIGHNYDGQDDQYLKPFQWRPTAPNGVAVHYEALGDFDELAEQVAAIVAADPARWFVLSRTCAECAAIHMKLIERRIPAVNKSGGLLFGTPPVRKALAYARLACDYQGARDDMEILGEIANVATINFTAPFTRRNHRDGCTNTKGWVDCGCPIIMEEGKDYCHARYYGQKAIQAAGSWRGIVEQQYETNRGGYPTMQAKGARDLVEFVERLEALKGDAGACLRMIIADCILPWTAAEYGLQDADLAEDGAVESLDLILNLIEPGQTMEAYLQAVDEISAGDAGEDDEHSVLVGTIHWSKGLERPGVILNATRLPIVSPKPIPGKLPMGRPATIEEERRLAFVAVTRAKDEVVVVTSKEWNGQDLPGSQFVRELGL